MKKLTVTFILILGASLFGNAAAGISSRAALGTPDSVIKDFYKWYITAIDNNEDPMKKGKATLKKYVTLRFINQVARDEELGADAFVQTQEWDKEWANHVTVSNLKVKGTTATAIVTFGSDDYPRVSVTLVKAAGVWKIDRVKDAVSNYSH